MCMVNSEGDLALEASSNEVCGDHITLNSN